jgi:nucleoside-diphosphate-sugar epimerase
MDRHLLIAGATGLIGRAAIEHFESLDGWRVTSMSRRAIPGRALADHVQADLLDGQTVEAALSSRADITHVLYAAVLEGSSLVSGWSSSTQMDTNTTMLLNLLDALERRAPRLRHITLMQGLKAYGSHVGPVPVPAKERWPRMPHEIFYWPQEDLLRARQAASSWDFTILRPELVLGNALGSPMNMVAAIGVYATTMRELGRPLRYPGGDPFVLTCTDSRLIAQAVEFGGTSPAAANETFNVVNGDALVWQDLVWPAVARHFGMELGEPCRVRLAETMPSLADTWTRIVQRHGLRELTMAEIVGSSWQFADLAFSPRAHLIESPIKLRQAGFEACFDSEDAILYWLTRMQADGVLPK